LNTNKTVCTQILFLLLAVGVSGCGGVRVVPVEGRVTLDDKPFPNVKVLFYLDGGGPETNYTAITDAEGHFSLASLDGKKSGVAPAAYSVSLTTAHWAPDALETDPPPTERVPQNQREQKFEVPADGTKEANFTITGK